MTSSIVTSSNPRSLKSWIALARILPRSLLFFSARKPISRHALLRLRFDRPGHAPNRRTTSVELFPPKAKELLRAVPISCLRLAFGT